MEFVLRSIEHAISSGALFPAVVTALTVPDIAGAVESPGSGSQARYAAWVDTWFALAFPDYLEHQIDGLALYALRCKLLHEGLSFPGDAPAAQKSPIAAQKRLIAFNIGPGRFHLCSATDASNDSWTILRAEQFGLEMTQAARCWIDTKKSDMNAQVALSRLVDIRTEVPPLSSGIPLICAAL